MDSEWMVLMDYVVMLRPMDGQSFPQEVRAEFTDTEGTVLGRVR